MKQLLAGALVTLCAAAQAQPAGPAPSGPGSAGNVFNPNRAIALAAGVPPPATEAAAANGLLGGQPPANLPRHTSIVSAGQQGAEDSVDVPAVFVGRINGMNVWRGTSTYVFDKTRRPKLVPKPDAGDPVEAAEATAAPSNAKKK